MQAVADECSAGGTHNYIATILVPPTIDAPGTRRFVCSKCGAYYDVAIPAIGHQWGPWVVDAEPTCTDEGTEHRICSEGKSYEHIEYKTIPSFGGHSFEMIDRRDSTCCSYGTETYRCTRCGYEEILQTSEPLAEHVWKVVVTREPSCTVAGEQELVCSVCGTVGEFDELPATGHAWSEWVIVQDPTSEQEGLEERTCSICGAVENRSLGCVVKPEVDEDATAESGSDGDCYQLFDPARFLQGVNEWTVVLGVGDCIIFCIGLFVLGPLCYPIVWFYRERRHRRGHEGE